MKFGESTLNSGCLSRFDSAGRTCYTYFCSVFNCILQPTEAAIDVMSGRLCGQLSPISPQFFVVLAKNYSPEIRPEAFGGGIFDRLSNFDKNLPTGSRW